MKILCVGPTWRGSNAGGLFKALSRRGYLTEVLDEFYYLSLKEQGKILKIATYLLRPWQIEAYNQAILKKFKLFSPDIVLVYKGAFVKPQTLAYIKHKSAKIVNFYPDVSMYSHGKLLPKTMGMYDLVFTTKSFGLIDLKKYFGIGNSIFIPHGFDPEIHRILTGFESLKKQLTCDVSFIGTWSPKKERYLNFLKTKIPSLNLKIWGNQWEKCTVSNLKTSIQFTEITGDLYALAIQASKINLGLLSERVIGASSGDKITSRTFHIPGSGGFMLHERTEESILYFEEDKEVVFFDSPEELVKQVIYYLEKSSLREEIKIQGYHRALKDHSLDQRAFLLVTELKKLLAN